MCPPAPEEDPQSIWARAKTQIRSQISEIAFLNWFSCTRQVMANGSRVDVAVPDQATEAYLRCEYHDVVIAALSKLGVKEFRFVCDPIVARMPSSQNRSAREEDSIKVGAAS
jgi:chromosomal replication initiation ATPase DnaA